MRTRRAPCLLLLLVTTLVAAPADSVAQTPAPISSFVPADKLPFDSAVTAGTLPNGPRDYIRKKTKPEKRVALQLAVKAGSVDETDEQQGLAHFLEHMAFNSNPHYQPP